MVAAPMASGRWVCASILIGFFTLKSSLMGAVRLSSSRVSPRWHADRPDASRRRLCRLADNAAVEPNSRIIVALDFDNRRAAEEVVDRLGEECRFYKVGMELLTAADPDLIEHLVPKGKEVFLDLKLSRSRTPRPERSARLVPWVLPW
ncbi:orotidine 5'-phosphate decarboxylase / HUMPS family protein [Streptomyces sp. NPDC048211]|uniref:orotidine 5'-phosphate decarboxylase / HUMPS family protein n=1 Tax=Streptomyces sp. NPDC048211 TaxID=3365516 RepID=UPI00371FFD98